MSFAPLNPASNPAGVTVEFAVQWLQDNLVDTIRDYNRIKAIVDGVNRGDLKLDTPQKAAAYLNAAGFIASHADGYKSLMGNVNRLIELIGAVDPDTAYEWNNAVGRATLVVPESLGLLPAIPLLIIGGVVVASVAVACFFGAKVLNDWLKTNGREIVTSFDPKTGITTTTSSPTVVGTLSSPLSPIAWAPLLLGGFALFLLVRRR